jgi:hypothetical protein
MDRWDVLLAAFATYVAVVSLVRLMANRRNEVLAKIREELAKQRNRATANDDSHDQKAA